MSVNNLLKLIENSNLVKAFEERKPVANLSLTQEAYLLASTFNSNPRVIMVVKSNLYQAQILYQNINSLVDRVYLYGVEDSLRVEAIASSPELKAQRMDTIVSILDNTPKIVVTHVGAIVRYLPSVDIFKEQIISLKINQEVEYQQFKKQLYNLGYNLAQIVDQPLVYSSRGSIIDFWPANSEYPIRLEFFGDEIDSIRYFDPNSQSTIERVEKINLYPATDNIFVDEDIEKLDITINELLISEKEKLTYEHYESLKENVLNDLELIREHSLDNHLYRYRCLIDNYSILSYFSDLEIVVSDYQSIKASYHNMVSDTVNYLQELYTHRLFFLKLTHHFELVNLLSDFYEIKEFYDVSSNVDNDIKDVVVSNEGFKAKMNNLVKETKNKLLIINQHKINEVIESLLELDKEYVIVDDDEQLDRSLMIMVGDVSRGIDLSFANLIVYTNEELFRSSVRSSRFEKRFSSASVVSDFTELNNGDYVVHYQHGIGQYIGIVTREIDGIHKDYLQVVYALDSTLYVPIDQFKLVRKFVSGESAKPKLSKLGGKEWAKTKQQLSENVESIAERLVEIYASREENIGFAFSEDNELQKQFEDEFIYDLTEDQAIAIDEIKADMYLEKPMDRLLCGDVGFGKTEVAIRATFKVILDKKQVAYLCPTTILSMQHYKTFNERFENYPVNIALLNRFVSIGEQRRIIKDVKDGKIDILIGTHRILSNDVQYRDLGFLIIDEEQRFGVEHKEKIKELKRGVDVLSLSATPIPRTLQMSLIGIRSLSQLNTPPLNRLSVQTYVIEKNQQIITEVIQRELSRNGQVFFLHNRVEDIFLVANKLKEKLPHVRFATAHGQMDKEHIEDTMIKFINKEYDVLVCTTIIETGIDIPNANTIIIDQANRFGLAQLYQIKGRVGRSSSLGYAYLMYDPNKQMTETATKRLKAIKEFAQLGSGYKIAIRDLTIRGAGDLLGPNQSGFINTVGIDLYLEILREAIEKKRGTFVEKKENNLPIVNKVDGYIPKKFTDYDLEKINLYQEIEKAKKLSQLAKLVEKSKDIYGKLPKEVNLLFEKRKMELLLDDDKVEGFKQNPKGIEITFSKEYSETIDGVKLFTTISEISKDINLKFLNDKISVVVPNNIDWLQTSITMLERME